MSVFNSMDKEALDSLIAALHARNVLIVKVRRPWAGLLALGYKDVENRTWKPPQSNHCWILVAASKHVPTRAECGDALVRLAHCNAPPEVASFQTGPQQASDAIVGAIRIEGVQQHFSSPSVWHNPPDWGWKVDRAVAFETPVALDDDDKFQTKVWLHSRPQYASALLAQLDAQ